MRWPWKRNDILNLDEYAIFRLRGTPNTQDLRGVPTHQCLCGEDLFLIAARFERGEVVWYMLDGVCTSCGSLVTVPTPLDVN